MIDWEPFKENLKKQEKSSRIYISALKVGDETRVEK